MLELLATEFRTVEEVEAGLQRLEAHFWVRRDRRGVFATAYLHITRALRRDLEGGGFRNPAWVRAYLVSFGNLYRVALLNYERGEGPVAKAWRISFEAARVGAGFVIQHLVLGINAHINHDLPLALVEVGIDPARADKYHDHTRVNEVLQAATDGLKGEVSTRYAPVLSRLDRLAGRFDDDATRFSIPKAREHAWTFAVALTSCGSDPEKVRLRTLLDEQAAVLARLILAAPTRRPLLVRTVRLVQRLDAVVRRVPAAPR